ncbi:putative Helix-turn-helix [uncultured Eubacteriales bacterium]|uniref:Putative Helix-turn-helix n=1 Tax=uncultured Eubacteriales bacterium TaxID=172733 RepID=A0A212JJV8_9FIRM|nr:putative Helix-turn-helix [uncultured Eubacteriales bacterium]
MTVGEKIKIARSLKGITQKELGYLVGLPDVRIRQYETDARTPKEGMLREIASSLGVSYSFFVSHNIESLNDVMHVMFEVEHTFGVHIEKVERPGKPVAYAVLFEDTGLNERLKKWHEQGQLRLSNKGENEEMDYLSWETNFPESMN